METAIKSRLNVIKGGAWGRKLYSTGWRIENGYRHFKHLKVVTDHTLDMLALQELEDTGDIHRLYADLCSLDSNPYHPADLLEFQDTRTMIARLYRGGLPIPEIARIMHNYQYADYPFPSGGRK